ncbi:phosphatidylglycerophosphatase A family protein [Ligilactobacillus equi]|uniref:Phosphatidylglycerophosphatase A n=2 Tax=Ligilactobacillus equi TaxID=137357 RepID=V7HVN4_9LACO|nr:phosphatidylglycerophosphatase A [Ligilactobacillus equi]ETA73942.1 phosphatidylglycerophosphatase A [Ligilactobacillus equi DPC 6820]KRL80276.1 phosphatidylglycerophosphatase A [Ligilactobacillus equi DSM 15833 = JCM 10991]MCQ2556547.1 phosphatidylglycerophosphatase A [Ligilactobacillus sp.]
MLNQNFKYPDTAAYNFVTQELERRGVKLSDLTHLAYKLLVEFDTRVTEADCQVALQAVLHKREVLNQAMVALELDRLAQADQLREPLLSIIKNDAGVFGTDETLALAIANVYGTIGATNFGYLDRVKSGIIKNYDQQPNQVNTFIDDLLGALVAAICGKIAHQLA